MLSVRNWGLCVVCSIGLLDTFPRSSILNSTRFIPLKDSNGWSNYHDSFTCRKVHCTDAHKFYHMCYSNLNQPTWTSKCIKCTVPLSQHVWNKSGPCWRCREPVCNHTHIAPTTPGCTALGINDTPLTIEGRFYNQQPLETFNFLGHLSLSLSLYIYIHADSEHPTIYHHTRTFLFYL